MPRGAAKMKIQKIKHNQVIGMLSSQCMQACHVEGSCLISCPHYTLTYFWPLGNAALGALLA